MITKCLKREIAKLQSSGKIQSKDACKNKIPMLHSELIRKTKKQKNKYTIQ